MVSLPFELARLFPPESEQEEPLLCLCGPDAIIEWHNIPPPDHSRCTQHREARKPSLFPFPFPSPPRFLKDRSSVKEFACFQERDVFTLFPLRQHRRPFCSSSAADRRGYPSHIPPPQSERCRLIRLNSSSVPRSREDRRSVPSRCQEAGWTEAQRTVQRPLTASGSLVPERVELGLV